MGIVVWMRACEALVVMHSCCSLFRGQSLLPVPDWTVPFESTADSNKLEHGRRMMHAFFSTLRLEESHVPAFELLRYSQMKSAAR